MTTASGYGPLAAARKLWSTPPGGLAAAAASISIPATSIPQSLATLIVQVHGRGDTAAIAVNVGLRINGDAGANYYGEQRYAVGGSFSATDLSAQTSMLLGSISAASAPVGAAGLILATLPDYTGTTYRKTLHGDYGLTNADTTSGHVSGSVYGEWYNAAAVTSLLLLPSAGNFAAGTFVTLWGLA